MYGCPPLGYGIQTGLVPHGMADRCVSVHPGVLDLDRVCTPRAARVGARVSAPGDQIWFTANGGTGCGIQTGFAPRGMPGWVHGCPPWAVGSRHGLHPRSRPGGYTGTHPRDPPPPLPKPFTPPLLTEHLAELRVVQVGVLHRQPLPLVLRPHHERVHGPADAALGAFLPRRTTRGLRPRSQPLGPVPLQPLRPGEGAEQRSHGPTRPRRPPGPRPCPLRCPRGPRAVPASCPASLVFMSSLEKASSNDTEGNSAAPPCLQTPQAPDRMERGENFSPPSARHPPGGGAAPPTFYFPPPLRFYYYYFLLFCPLKGSWKWPGHPCTAPAAPPPLHLKNFKTQRNDDSMERFRGGPKLKVPIGVPPSPLPRLWQAAVHLFARGNQGTGPTGTCPFLPAPNALTTNPGWALPPPVGFLPRIPRSPRTGGNLVPSEPACPAWLGS